MPQFTVTDVEEVSFMSDEVGGTRIEGALLVHYLLPELSTDDHSHLIPLRALADEQLRRPELSLEDCVEFCIRDRMQSAYEQGGPTKMRAALAGGTQERGAAVRDVIEKTSAFVLDFLAAQVVANQSGQSMRAADSDRDVAREVADVLLGRALAPQSDSKVSSAKQDMENARQVYRDAVESTLADFTVDKKADGWTKLTSLLPSYESDVDTLQAGNVADRWPSELLTVQSPAPIPTPTPEPPAPEPLPDLVPEEGEDPGETGGGTPVDPGDGGGGEDPVNEGEGS